MNAVEAISYGTQGLLDQGPTVPTTGEASSGGQASEAHAAAPALAAAATVAKDAKPGTIHDVAEANIAAKSSADLLGTPSPEYASAMAVVVQTASANARAVGARLDISM
jgi:hypothetical protein